MNSRLIGEIGKRYSSNISTLKPIAVSIDLIVHSVTCLLLTGGRR